MYPFSESINPAVRTHLDAQTAFVNDMSKSLFSSFQQMCDLNIQLAQTLLEETTLTSQRLLTAGRQSELWSAAAERARPTSDKLRAYQQHLSRVAADAQVELARVTEQHASTTARTARALADEVVRTANEASERGARAQQDSAAQFTDPFARAAEAAASGWTAERPGASLQNSAQPNGAPHADQQTGLQQGMQGGAPQGQYAGQQGGQTSPGRGGAAPRQ